MSLVSKSEYPCRAGTCDDGDLAQRVLSPEPISERAIREKLPLHPADLLVSIGAIHQQANELGVRHERAAIRMVGRENQAPWIGGQEKELEADGPLERGDGAPVPVLVRDDAASRLELDVDVRPLPATALVQQVFDGRV